MSDQPNVSLTAPPKFHAFVYGTLRRGNGAEYILGEDREFLGTCRVPGFMVNVNNAFPGVHFPNGAPSAAEYADAARMHGVGSDSTVEGDVFLVNLSSRGDLDRYEGVPHLYTHTRVETPYGSALAYEFADLFDHRPLVGCGNWNDPVVIQHIEEQQRAQREAMFTADLSARHQGILRAFEKVFGEEL